MYNKMLLALATTLVMGATSLEAVPTNMSYQGRLVTTTNQTTAVVNGEVKMRFALYNSADVTGTNVKVWPLGDGYVTKTVVVTNGLYSVTLDGLNPELFNQDLWLEVQVADNTSSPEFETLSPRTQMTTTPYSYYAGTATKVIDDAITPAMIKANVIGAGLQQNNSDKKIELNTAYSNKWTANQIFTNIQIENENNKPIINSGQGTSKEGYLKTRNPQGDGTLVTLGSTDGGQKGAVSVGNATALGTNETEVNKWRASMAYINGTEFPNSGILSNKWMVGAGNLTQGKGAVLLYDDATTPTEHSTRIAVLNGTPTPTFTVDQEGDVVAKSVTIDGKSAATEEYVNTKITGTADMTDNTYSRWDATKSQFVNGSITEDLDEDKLNITNRHLIVSGTVNGTQNLPRIEAPYISTPNYINSVNSDTKGGIRMGESAGGNSGWLMINDKEKKVVELGETSVDGKYGMQINNQSDETFRAGIGWNAATSAWTAGVGKGTSGAMLAMDEGNTSNATRIAVMNSGIPTFIVDKEGDVTAKSVTIDGKVAATEEYVNTKAAAAGSGNFGAPKTTVPVSEGANGIVKVYKAGETAETINLNGATGAITAVSATINNLTVEGIGAAVSLPEGSISQSTIDGLDAALDAKQDMITDGTYLSFEVDGFVGNEVAGVTDATLVISGTGEPATPTSSASPKTIALNLGNTNTWTGVQTFSATGTGLTATTKIDAKGTIVNTDIGTGNSDLPVKIDDKAEVTGTLTVAGATTLNDDVTIASGKTLKIDTKEVATKEYVDTKATTAGSGNFGNSRVVGTGTEDAPQIVGNAGKVQVFKGDDDVAPAITLDGESGAVTTTGDVTAHNVILKDDQGNTNFQIGTSNSNQGGWAKLYGDSDNALVTLGNTTEGTAQYGAVSVGDGTNKGAGMYYDTDANAWVAGVQNTTASAGAMTTANGAKLVVMNGTTEKFSADQTGAITGTHLRLQNGTNTILHTGAGVSGEGYLKTKNTTEPGNLVTLGSTGAGTKGAVSVGIATALGTNEAEVNKWRASMAYIDIDPTNNSILQNKWMVGAGDLTKGQGAVLLFDDNTTTDSKRIAVINGESDKPTFYVDQEGDLTANHATFKGTISGVIPTENEHLATKAYVDSKVNEGGALAKANIMIGDGSMPSKAVARAISGDVSLSEIGVVNIVAGAVTSSKIASGTILPENMDLTPTKNYNFAGKLQQNSNDVLTKASSVDDLEDVQLSGTTVGAFMKYSDGKWKNIVPEIADINELQTALYNKADKTDLASIQSNLEGIALLTDIEKHANSLLHVSDAERAEWDAKLDAVTTEGSIIGNGNGTPLKLNTDKAYTWGAAQIFSSDVTLGSAGNNIIDVKGTMQASGDGKIVANDITFPINKEIAGTTGTLLSVTNTGGGSAAKFNNSAATPDASPAVIVSHANNVKIAMEVTKGKVNIADGDVNLGTAAQGETLAKISNLNITAGDLNMSNGDITLEEGRFNLTNSEASSAMIITQKDNAAYGLWVTSDAAAGTVATSPILFVENKRYTAGSAAIFATVPSYVDPNIEAPVVRRNDDHTLIVANETGGPGLLVAAGGATINGGLTTDALTTDALTVGGTITSAGLLTASAGLKISTGKIVVSSIQTAENISDNSGTGTINLSAETATMILLRAELVGTDIDLITLPTGEVGQILYIVNNTGEAISANSTAISIPSGKIATFICVAAGTWMQTN